MCCKAVETTRNINNEFDPGTGDSRSFAKETRPLTMRSAVFGRGMFTTANWEDHRSWSSYNYAGSCWRTQHGPLYGHLTFEANWKSEKLGEWVPYLSCGWLQIKKKIIILKCCLNSTQLQQTISWSDYDMWQKVDLYKATTSSAVGSRRSRKALPKAKLEPKNVMVTGGLLPIWFTVTCCCCCCCCCCKSL